MSDENRMIILHCEVCETFYIPPKYFCTKCGYESLKGYTASGAGRIYTFTTIHAAPESFRDQVPYDIAIVELDEGIKVTARVKKMNEGSIKIGDLVRFFKKDEIGYWFKK
jgi:hypothetical protein